MDVDLLYHVSFYLQQHDVDLEIRRAVNSAIAAVADARAREDFAEADRGIVALRALTTRLPFDHRIKFFSLVNLAAVAQPTLRGAVTV